MKGELLTRQDRKDMLQSGKGCGDGQVWKGARQGGMELDGRDWSSRTGGSGVGGQVERSLVGG